MASAAIRFAASMLIWIEQVTSEIFRWHGAGAAECSVGRGGRRWSVGDLRHVRIHATPERGSGESARAACEFLRALLNFVVGAEDEMPGIRRAMNFLNGVERRLGGWTKRRRREERVRQRLVFTLPSRGDGQA